MKKTLVSALTTALVVGAASTTFAAANPFADVPADHWAYDAVAQLVQDGVVNGYGADGTFKGDQNMSRYEMAQIVAKAMAKSDAADNNNKALIEKLSAEFSDELANLGVRVANLEAKTDNVKWTGLIRYDWNNTNREADNGANSHRNDSDNQLKLRFEPSITINDNWTAHSQIDYNITTDDNVRDLNSADPNAITVEKIYTEGVYGKADIKLGRFGSFSDASHGLVFDTRVTGAEVSYAPTDKWTVKATAGKTAPVSADYQGTLPRPLDNTPALASGNLGEDATYLALEANYKNGKLGAGLGYHRVSAQDTALEGNGDLQIVDTGVSYAFNDTVKATVDYAFGNGDWTEGQFSNNAYSIQVDYKGAKADQKGSWGAYVAYRSLSPIAAFQATYDHKAGFAGLNSLKGWEIGANYTWAKNIVSTFKYFNGKDTDRALELIDRGDRVTGVWSRVDFLF